MMSTEKFYLLLTAAGSSSRFEGGKKEYFSLDGKSILMHSIEAFCSLDGLSGIVITYPRGGLEEMQKAIVLDAQNSRTANLADSIVFVEGGSMRQASVLAGLEALESWLVSLGANADSQTVLIHDGARPWISPELISKVLDSTQKNGACIPLDDFTDTPKIIDTKGFISEHPERSFVKAAQTPQGFLLGPLLAAHRKANEEAWLCTDDSSMWQRYVKPVAYVQGDRKNRKITYKDDIPSLEQAIAPFSLRIGEGWDIHPLVEGRRLLLGGVPIEFERGESGHSDGDVLWHAIIDALLGAASLGDIGTLFPPQDARWKNADSSDLAKTVSSILKESGLRLTHLDCTVVIERPRLSPYREAIRSNIAKVLDVPRDSVSVKAKTYESFGPVGEGLAVEARAIALIALSPSF